MESNLCQVCDGNFFRKNHFQCYCTECSLLVKEIQQKAAMVVAKAIREDRLAPAYLMRCVDCGGFAAAWEHRYYSLPEEVVATCHECNQKRGPALDVRVLANELRKAKKWAAGQTIQTDPKPVNLEKLIDDFEHRAISAAIVHADFKLTKAATLLGISYRSLRYRLNRLKIGNTYNETDTTNQPDTTGA